MAEIYILCQTCTHTANVHGDKGCGAHNCTCSVVFPKS